MWKFLVVAAGVLTLAACTNFEVWEDLDKVDRDAEFAVPLVDTKIALQDLFDGLDQYSSLQIDSDGLLRFHYISDTTVRLGREVFDAVNEAIPPILPVEKPQNALYLKPPDSIFVDFLVFKTGQLQYFFTNPHDVPLEVTLTLPQIAKNGQPLQRTHDVLPNSPIPLQTFDLRGYALQPENDSIHINYEARRPDGSLDTLPLFLITTKDIEFTYAEGLLGRQVFDNSIDTIDIDFYDNWTQGEVFFENPRVTIRVDNSFGVPTQASVDVFKVITVRGDTLELESPFIENGFDFDYPALGQQGMVRQTNFDFDKNNSNIEDLLGGGPVGLIYDIDAVTNPAGSNNVTGFITDTSYFSYYLDVELPLYGRAKDFSVRDTTEVAFADFGEVEAAEFKIVTKNELGLNVDLQGYFLDDKGAVIDSLFAEKSTVIAAAPVDAEGFTTQAAEQTTFAEIPAERFAPIKKATALVLETSFSTYENGTQSVRVLAEQEVTIRIGVKIGL